MKNQQRPNDFFVDVPGVGRFRFNRRTYGANIKASATTARILGPGGSDEEQDPMMLMHAALVSAYSSLMSDCPPGWEDIEAIDITDSEQAETDVLRVWIELKKRLDSFRSPQGAAGAQSASEGEGAGVAQEDRVLGAPALPDAADRPEVAGA